MRRHVILTVALIHLVGTLAVPAAAYCCAVNGDASAVTHAPSSPRPYCDDSCSEGAQEAPNAHAEQGVPCCDHGAQTASPRGRVLLPDRKSGPAETCDDVSERLDVFLTNVLAVTAPPSIQETRSSINTPLRI